MNKLIIREATIKDRDKIVDFQLAMALETENLQLDKNIVKKGVQGVFEKEGRGKYYVGEINGEVISSLLTTYEWSDWRNGTILWIQSVFVEQNHRGKGIFKTMYQHIKDLVLSDQSYNGIRLYVDKTNTGAQKVYTSLGMDGNHYDLYEWFGQ